MIGEGLERYEPALLTTIYVMMYNFRVTMIMLFFFYSSLQPSLFVLIF